MLIGLTEDVLLRQVSVGYELHPQPTDVTLPWLTGHITPTRVMGIPETDHFRDLDVEAGVANAQVHFKSLSYRFNLSLLGSRTGKT
jgi:hypothetical protein